MIKSPFGKAVLFLAYTALVVFVTWYFVAPSAKAPTNNRAAPQKPESMPEPMPEPDKVERQPVERPIEPKKHEGIVVGKGQQFETLQQAIKAAPDGSTITILEGEYYSSRTIDVKLKYNLTIKGEGKVSLLGTDMESDVIHVQNSKNIVFDNLTVKHTNPPTDTRCYGNVFSLWGSKEVTIKNSDINGSGVVGVMSYEQDGLTLENNIFHRNQYAGVDLYTPKGVSRLINNTFDDNGVHVEYRGRSITENVNERRLEMSGNHFLSPPKGPPPQEQ